MRAEERWKPQQKTPVTREVMKRPKQVLRDTSSVLTQGPLGGHSSYKIPPGTTRTNICPDSNDALAIKAE